MSGMVRLRCLAGPEAHRGRDDHAGSARAASPASGRAPSGPRPGDRWPGPAPPPQVRAGHHPSAVSTSVVMSCAGLPGCGHQQHGRWSIGFAVRPGVGLVDRPKSWNRARSNRAAPACGRDGGGCTTSRTSAGSTPHQQAGRESSPVGPPSRHDDHRSPLVLDRQVLATRSSGPALRHELGGHAGDLTRPPAADIRPGRRRRTPHRRPDGRSRVRGRRTLSDSGRPARPALVRRRLVVAERVVVERAGEHHAVRRERGLGRDLPPHHVAHHELRVAPPAGRPSRRHQSS